MDIAKVKIEAEIDDSQLESQATEVVQKVAEKFAALPSLKVEMDVSYAVAEAESLKKSLYDLASAAERATEALKALDKAQRLVEGS